MTKEQYDDEHHFTNEEENRPICTLCGRVPLPYEEVLPLCESGDGDCICEKCLNCKVTAMEFADIVGLQTLSAKDFAEKKI